MKKFILLLLLVLALPPTIVWGSATVMPTPKQQFLDSNGNPLNGGLLYTCKVGTTCGPSTTTNLKDTYTDSTAATANPNPVVLDSAGRAAVWMSGFYKVSLYTRTGTLVWSIDNVSSTADSSNSTWVIDAMSYGANYTDVTIQAAITAIGSASATLGIGPGAWVISNNLIIPANIVFKVLNGATLTVASGKTLTVNGPVEAGAYRWIYGAGTTTINTYPQDATWRGNTQQSQFNNLNVTHTTGMSVGGFTFPTYSYHYQNQQVLNNVGFTATVESNNLTVALKGADGNDPSTTNVVSANFRSSTLTIGTPVQRYATAATSVVLPSGGTLGFTSGEVGRLYVWLVDNAGTLVLGLSRRTDMFPEDTLVTTTTIGAGSTSTSTMYTTTGVTSKAVRCIGYIEITTGATAGQWTTAPTKLQVMGPGVHRTGDIVQRVPYYLATFVSGSTAIPFDNTIPQNGEGYTFLTHTGITPTSAMNRLLVEVEAYMENAVLDADVGAIFRDSVANAVQAAWFSIGGLSGLPVRMRYEAISGSTSNTVFKFAVGNAAGHAVEMNGYNGSILLGGVSKSSMVVTEIFE